MPDGMPLDELGATGADRRSSHQGPLSNGEGADRPPGKGGARGGPGHNQWVRRCQRQVKGIRTV